MFAVYILFGFIALTYSLLLYALIKGWNKLKQGEKGFDNSFPVYISVIIAARNEENNIAKTLNAIANQTYSEKLFDVLIVDDASEDKTAQIIESFCRKQSNFHSISFKNHKGKKTAVDFAVKNAKGNLIVQTDADCIPNPGWLADIAAYYQKNPAQMIIAPVLMSYTNHFEAMQSLDFLALMASGMAAAGFGKPIMNNAANLIFEKQAYLNLKNPNRKKIPSGDDVFFLLNLENTKNAQINVLKSINSIVYTNAQKTFKAFINQRKRWASKSKYYNNSAIIFTAITVFLMNFSLLISLILSSLSLQISCIFLFLLLFKSIWDYIFLNKITDFFNNKELLKYFFPVQIFNIFLIPYFAISGLFYSGKWK